MKTAFGEEAEAAGRAFRTALAGVAAAGQGGTEPAAMVDRFGIDATLAWKLSRQLSAGSGVDVFRFMPGAAALRGLVGRAVDRGVPREATAALVVAVDAYEQLVRRHAGSRRAFDVLVAGHLAEGGGGDGGESRLELDLRRSGFEAGAFVQGIKAATQFAVTILWPDGDRISLGVIRGALGLQRLRVHAMWRVSHTARITGIHTASPGTSSSVAMAPIDQPPEGKGATGLPLMHGFSSVGDEVFRQTETSDELIEYELAPGEVGDSSAMDLIFGERIDRARPRHAGEAGLREFTHMGGIKTPCERFVYDALVHRDLFERSEPVARAFSTVYARSTTDTRDADELPLRSPVEPRGAGLGGLDLPGCPRHIPLLRHAMARLGLDEGAFNASRLMIQYPPAPMTLRMVWLRGS
ncbi:MAG: hypothetical protein AAGF47_03580 [Planctomycetota bacterium]